jgi:MFS transporter, DHA1 family, multidrug resistance protein
VFQVKHGFTISQGGLVFIGVGLGTTSGSAINYYFSRHYPELVIKWRGYPPPEERLYGAMVGAPAMVIGAFWLGWTGTYPGIHWIVPALSTFFIGNGICLILISFASYMIDTYL